MGMTVAIAVAVAIAVVVTMAIDHLIGNESPRGDFPVDPAAFVIATVLALALTALLFLLVVRPSPPERAPRRAIICSGLAVITLPMLWLALPFPFAGAGMALGLAGRGRLATVAVVIGALVLGLGLAGYVATLL